MTCEPVERVWPTNQTELSNIGNEGNAGTVRQEGESKDGRNLLAAVPIKAALIQNDFFQRACGMTPKR